MTEPRDLIAHQWLPGRSSDNYRATPMYPRTPSTHGSRARTIIAMVLLGIAVLASVRPSNGYAGSANRSPGSAATANLVAQEPTDAAAPTETLSAADAIILGLVEGITEYLPVSSTGHLVVTERLLGIGETDEARDAIDSYTVIIQFGAIIAVVFLYWPRIVQLLRGIVGRSEPGRRLFHALVVAFIPAPIVGFVGSALIDEHLLKPIPIAAAWIVGGIGILVFVDRLRRDSHTGTLLEDVTIRQAVLIGGMQVLALWPGMSRSLVTIVGALLAGMTLAAAVEFSFLLGLATLSGASLYFAAKDGSEVVDTFGLAMPLLGIVVAGISAAVAVRSLVAYLNKRDLKIFGWYRIVIGVATIALVITDVI